MGDGTAAFDSISWDELKQRRSAKWRRYPPDVLPSWVAEMDFPLAAPVRQILREAVGRDDTGYAWFEGFPETAAGFLVERLKWAVEPAQISPLPDVMAGVTESLRRLIEPGDGVVINTPVYHLFFSAIPDARGRVVEVPLARDGTTYRLDLDALEAAFAAGARAYLLCSPHNPTGNVFSEADLAAVAALARRYDVAVVADEIHGPLALAGATFTPYLSVHPEAGRRAVALTSASKAFNLPGLKCAALVVTDAETRALIDTIPDEVRYRTGLLGVLASIAAFGEGGPWLDDVLDYLDGNRRLLADLLAERLPLAGYTPPQATCLAWIDLSAYDLGPDPVGRLLERGKVALTAGLEFGGPGEGFVRLNFGTSRALLTEIVDRMARAILGRQPIASPTASSRP
ncbi:MAG: aminotransferase class I/II-fold pyridoxal phosphate-dependent enzyme [Actinomycetota bacterium]|nr:aminotransferase class I/II-fold pyridoxal phosphate-dependent enzyme [Actinomycetota bacterium]